MTDKITRNMYRDALHIYLKHAFPNDDGEYYSKWAWMVRPAGHTFWERDRWSEINKEAVEGIPREVRFGCYVSGNTKLRCYSTGFMFDTNACGDSQEIVDEVYKIKKIVEDEWEKIGLPVHERNLEKQAHSATPDKDIDKGESK